MAVSGLSKYSRWSLVENPSRAIQRFERRLVAMTSMPQYRWWYPSRLVYSSPPASAPAPSFDSSTA